MPKDSDVCVYSEGCGLDVDKVYEFDYGQVVLTSKYETIEDREYFPKDESVCVYRYGMAYFENEYKGDLT